MSNFIPNLRPPQKNDLTKKQTLNVIHKRTAQHADGSGEMYEKSLDYSTSTHAEGSEWLGGRKKFRLPNEDHFRQDSSQIVVRDKKVINDGRGNILTEEHAFQVGNESTSSGTLQIGNRPEIKADKRPELYDKFSSSSNAFTFFSKTSSKLLK